MKYICRADSFWNYHDTFPMKAFSRAMAAKMWLEELAGRVHDAPDDDCVEEGSLYRVEKDGTCVLIAKFDGAEDATSPEGFWVGWTDVN